VKKVSKTKNQIEADRIMDEFRKDSQEVYRILSKAGIEISSTKQKQK